MKRLNGSVVNTLDQLLERKSQLIVQYNEIRRELERINDLIADELDNQRSVSASPVTYYGGGTRVVQPQPETNR